MPSLPLLRAIGLNFSPNQLEAQPGSLVEASNIIIRRDNVIESRRGYSLYGTPMGVSSDRCKQLLVYKNKLIRHYANKLQFEDGLSNSGEAQFFDFNEIQNGSAFPATISEAQTDLKIKAIEANSNFYLTTSEGIKKISAKTADAFTASNITKSGGIKALDVSATLNTSLGDTSSFLPGDAGVAYKIVWGTKDANNNLILGTPSDPVTILNPLINLTLKDFSNFLLQLDNTAYTNTLSVITSLISDTNYSSLSLPIDSLSNNLRENLIQLAAKLDQDLLMASSTGTGNAYSTLKIAGIASKTANVTTGTNTITVSPDASGILLGMTVVGTGVFGTVTNIVGTTITLSQNATVTDSALAVNFSSVSISSGVAKILFDPLSIPSNYFISGDSIYVPVDPTTSPATNGFTSNGVGIDALNKNNTVSTVSAASTLSFVPANVSTGADTITITSHGLSNNTPIAFQTQSGTALPSPLVAGTVYYVINATINDFQVSTSSGGGAIDLTTAGTGTNLIYATVPSYIEYIPRDYSATNFTGISGTISSIPSISPFSSGTVTVTSNNHGIKNGQKITITGSNSQASIDGTYAVTVLSDNTFSISLGSQYTGLSVTLTTGTGDLVLTSASNHGFTAGTVVQFSASSFTNTNLVANKDYYVIASGLTATQFKVSDSPVGTPIIQNNTGAGTGVTVSKYIKSAGNAASWNIVVDGISTVKIESNEFRSIEQPLEQTTIPANNQQVTSLKDYFIEIVQKLQEFVTNRSGKVIDQTVYQTYLESISETTASTVSLRFTIPSDILEFNSSSNPYFYQIYRTDISQAEGTSVIGDPLTFGIIQEYKQIEEGFPSSTDFTNGYVSVTDISPESIAGTGANLYTNVATAAGDPSPNDIPPFALDINTFKGYTFFSNTKTRQRKLITLLPVVSMIQSYSSFGPYKLTIADKDVSNTYSFVTGIKQITSLTCGIANNLASSGASSYFTLNSANNETGYYVWYQRGTSVDPGLSVPALSGKKAIKVPIMTGDINTVVAQKTSAAIGSALSDFTISVLSNVVTITNTNYGTATNAAFPSTPPTGFSLSTTPGRGEDVTTRQVLIYGDLTTSPSIAIEETAKSLVRVINRNSSEIINAFYLSGPDDSPGSLFLEGRGLKDEEFYILGENSVIGNSFNPSVSPNTVTILSASVANPSVITTSAAHGLTNGDSIIVTNSTTTPNIDGIHQITWLSSTTFSIPVNVTVSGTAVFKDTDDAEVSSNEEQPHRVYYSKYQQPEAVPLLNYIDIGATDRRILRIFPLRDSLFVFKEDGLFRISGETAPFSVALFDSSCIILAPDSLSLANNQIFVWTTQGISSVTEAGVTLLSRPIDIEILKKASSDFSNFKKATWGVGYESDNSYTVYTVNNPEDSIPNIGFRYSTLTNSWTTVDKSFTCGIINPSDDKLYLGAGDTNYLEKERKSFNRYDYSDRQYDFEITSTNFNSTNNRIVLSDVSDLSIGDVITQEQTVTVYEFNLLLRKLDNDSGTAGGYFSALEATVGDNMRDKLVDLAQALDADPNLLGSYYSLIQSRSGSVTSASVANPAVITTSSAHNLQSNRYVIIESNTRSEVNGTFKITVTAADKFTIPVDLLAQGTGGSYTTDDENFLDLKICYNYIINALNNDPGTSFSNYRFVDNSTIQEVIITNINRALRTVTFNLPVEFIQGTITAYNAIPCSLTYSPLTLDDPLGLKHIRESTMMFANKAFTNAKMRFSTDLLPEFIEIEFNGDGNGIFGHSSFGTGFFGGASNSAPFRTYIPRQCQRCRFINVGFEHRIAREQFAIYGITLTGEVGQSTRAYR